MACIGNGKMVDIWKGIMKYSGNRGAFYGKNII